MTTFLRCPEHGVRHPKGAGCPECEHRARLRPNMHHPGHEIIKCGTCRKIIQQCRCMSKDKVEWFMTCDDCKAKEAEQDKAAAAKAAIRDNSKAKLWETVAEAAFGNEWVVPNEPRIVVVTARYNGCYEPGRFVAIPAQYLDSEAFGDDIACSEWWHEHLDECGGGDTPDKALLDWFQKRQTRANKPPIPPMSDRPSRIGGDL